MFRFIYNKLKYYWLINSDMETAGEQGLDQSREEPKDSVLTGNLSADLEIIREIVGTSPDIKVHEFRYGQNSEIKGALVFVDGLVNSTVIIDGILKPLKLYKEFSDYQSQSITKSLDTVKQTIICAGEITEKHTAGEIVESCLSGDTAFLSDGFDKALVISSKGWEKREITEPQTEAVVRGPAGRLYRKLQNQYRLAQAKDKKPEA